MKFLIDENIPLKLAEEILKQYPKSKYVLDSDLRGKSDKSLFEFAKKEEFIIITFDTDFLDILSYPLENGSGRIVLRYKGLKINEIEEKTLKILKILENKNIKNSIVIVSNNKIRIKHF
ncbi:DUF5615 family PIN-like protein [Persephonella sp.]|uniref:DUF5615 family PIN-like protein n=1 Tax=Persephonella sp. TaxID=2060922 RepID=UPI002605E312|nr:DUF5615 family PIN-like protein [Persephonella sp.]